MEETLRAFAAYSWCLYNTKFHMALKNAIRKVRNESDVTDLLKIVLAGYIFERQGASPYFRWKALELVRQGLHNAPDQFWENFTEGANGVNEMCNPLRYDENHPERNLLCFFQDSQRIQEIVNNLGNSEIIIQTYKALDNIRGVGHKIASFILRDISMAVESRFAVGIQQDGDNVYWRMQPVDTWIKFTATQIGLCQEANREIKAAREICNRCIAAGVNPLRFNAGAWYFGAGVMRCREQLREILSVGCDHSRARLLLQAGLNRDVYEEEVFNDAYIRPTIADNSVRDHLITGIRECMDANMLAEIENNNH